MSSNERDTALEGEDATKPKKMRITIHVNDTELNSYKVIQHLNEVFSETGKQINEGSISQDQNQQFKIPAFS